MPLPKGPGLPVLKTEKQKLFLETYFANGLDPVDAWLVSRGKNRKEHYNASVRVKAWRYLQEPAIAPYIAAAKSKVVAKAEKILDKYAITQERIVEELAKIAFTPVTDVVSFGPDGVAVKDSAGLPDHVKGAIESVEETENKYGKKIKVKMADRRAALETLGKHLGMFSEKHEHRHMSVNFIIEK